MIGERTEAPHSLRERSPRLRKHLDKLSKCRDFPIELQHMYQRFRRGLNKSLVTGGNRKWNDLGSSSSGQEPRAHVVPSTIVVTIQSEDVKLVVEEAKVSVFSPAGAASSTRRGV